MSGRRCRRSSSAVWWWKRREGAATVGDFGGENGYMRRILEGNKINGGELPYLWPTPRARSTFRVFFFFIRSPRARLEKLGMAWTLRMDENQNPEENEKPGTQLGRITPSGRKKSLRGSRRGDG
jgi:hypothetical protein